MGSFNFMQCINLLKSTGRKARNLRELRAGIEAVGNESISYHTNQYFLKNHILEYTNDFANWAGEDLGERMLAEHLSSVDPYEFDSVGDIRKKLTDLIDEYLEVFPEPRDVMPGKEFHFNETVTIVFPMGVRARNLAEFLIAIRYVDAGSIFYHFYDARSRLGSGKNDFSEWFEESGKKDLADEIRAIDPFMHAIEGIREHIVESVDKAVREDMEGIAP